MGIEYEMVPFGPEIADAYSRLFPDDGDKTPDILAWRFRDNPHGPGMFAVAREDNIIRGIIGLIPTELVAGGEPVRGFQAVDGIVDRELRGRYVFVGLGRLVEDYVASQGAILWGFPNALAAGAWFGRLGWTRTGSVPFLIRPLRTGYLLRRLSPALARIDFRLASKPKNRAGHSSPPIDQDYEQLWAQLRGRLGIAVERTEGWLRWRLSKPGPKYRWSFDDRRKAFVATRRLEKHGGVIAYVMEAIAGSSDRDALTRLLREEVARETDAGAEVALAWCSPRNPAYKSYRAAGFLPFPDRLRPTEMHHGFWLPEGNSRLARIAGRDWYLSYLDSDTV